MAEDERIADGLTLAERQQALVVVHMTRSTETREIPGFVVVKPRRPSSAALVKPWYVEQHGLRSRSPQEQETQGDEQYPCKRPVLDPASCCRELRSFL